MAIRSRPSLNMTRQALALALLCLVLPAPAQETSFDPRDLSGVWSGPAGGRRPFGPNRPPITPAGLARYVENVPTDSIDPRVPAAAEPSLSNDPAFACNPRGFPRAMFGTLPFEFIHLEDRILQLLQRERTLRELWMDGRALPSGENLDNIGPAWYGHSVAEWQGDELIVNTVGLEDRAWLDGNGHPQSFLARVEERYRRIGPDTLELRMTLHDPTYYAGPWETEVRHLQRVPPEELTFFGWTGMFSGIADLMCAPMNATERHMQGAY